ncbi:hypothetical protein NKL05_21520 [Mesorhizobium sp. C420B]|uniref:hypothetical protein n=1 Tax=unclassified Mesorhizobium TaxID=325217 RepID=UPI0012EBE6CF|nr:hypothetical protein [Mesorhizobium sp. LSHC420B00]
MGEQHHFGTDGVDQRRRVIAMAEEIVFCARTGHRIVGDNVIPFPSPHMKPVAVDVVKVAKALTCQPTPAEDGPPEPGDDI